MLRPLKSLRRAAPVIAFLIVCALRCNPLHAAIPAAEREVLLAFYESTGGPGWKEQDGWRETEDAFGEVGTECTWDGVDCDTADEHVIELRLPRNRLTGKLPAALSGLAALQRILLADNRLIGVVPNELGQISTLETIDLSGNQLSGALPAAMFAISSITEIDLSSNRLRGGIPRTIGRARGLRRLHLNHNYLEGAIPTEIGQLHALEVLTLAQNVLSGPLPAELGRLTSLEYLVLSGNRFTGVVPATLGRLDKLSYLNLAFNDLRGSIRFADSLRSLGSLHLQGNQFVGGIPANLGRTTPLRYLDLSHNRLTGNLPRTLAWLRHLSTLKLRRNRLRGRLPPSFPSRALAEVDLSHNEFEGSVAHLSMENLIELRLAHNRFSGPLTVFEQARRLRVADLGHNQFTGPVPVFGDDVERIDLSHNRLAGPIPGGLGLLEKLAALDLSSNALTGGVPAEVLALPDLQLLRLAENQLTHLPFDVLANAPALRLLDVRRNRLGGTLTEQQLPRRIAALDVTENPELRVERGKKLDQLAARPSADVRTMLVPDDEEEELRTEASPGPRVVPTPEPAPPSSLPGPFAPSGRLVDETGAPLPGAIVTAQSPDGKGVIAQSDADGRFRFTGLPAGVYNVKGEMAGFATWRRGGVQFLLGAPTELEIVLSIGLLQEAITVSYSDPQTPGPFWNSWVHEISATRPLALRLVKGKRYRLTIDISRNAYREGLSAEVDDALAELAFRKHRDDPGHSIVLWALPTVLGRAVFLGEDPGERRLIAATWRNGAWERETNVRRIRMEIDLARLLTTQSDPEEAVVAEEADALEALGKDVRAGGVQLDLYAAEEGCATVALSLWNEALHRPVDHVVHHLQVGESASCGEHLRDARVGSGLAGLLRQTDYADADAAFYVAEFDTAGIPSAAGVLVPGTIHDAGVLAKCGGYFNWEMRGVPSDFMFRKNGAFDAAMAAAWSDKDNTHPFDRVAYLIEQMMFAGSDDPPCGRKAAFQYLEWLGAQPHRRILLRLTRDQDPVFFPLGLLFFLTRSGDGNTKRNVFAHPVTVSQPLDVQDAPHECVADWTFALPEHLDGFGPVALPAEITAPGLIRKIDELRNHLETYEPEGPAGIVVLAHHFDQTLYFDRMADSVVYSEIQRPLKPGSAVLLSACATGSPAHHGYLARDLNEGGADLMILSPFNVPAEFGVRLAIEFSRRVLEALNRERSTPVRTVFEESVAAVVGDNRIYAGLAAQFVFAGHEDVSICPRDK